MLLRVTRGSTRVIIVRLVSTQASGAFNLQKYFKRSFLLCLFIFGIGGSLFRWGVLDPAMFLAAGSLEQYLAAGIDPEYTKEVAFFLAVLVAPVALALFSFGWGLEDLRLYRIQPSATRDSIRAPAEPLYRGIIEFLKGYAGLAALFYYTALVVYGYRSNAVNDFYAILALLLVMILQLYPIYWIYWGLVRRLAKKTAAGIPSYTPETAADVMSRVSRKTD
jgi:hypothetical protein